MPDLITLPAIIIAGRTLLLRLLAMASALSHQPRIRSAIKQDKSQMSEMVHEMWTRRKRG